MTSHDNEIRQLSTEEQDALGEIGNICMGTSATTLSTLLDKRVTITTPRVSVVRGNEYLNEYERPVVTTEVSYTQGLDGDTIFLLKKDDALLITAVLLGGGDQVEELYLSAISEVMNQMVGASSTALADILHTNVNISPPVTREIKPEDAVEQKEQQNQEVYIRISFKLEIEGLLTSNIMQLLPFEFGKNLVRSLMNPPTPVRQEIVPDMVAAMEPLSAADTPKQNYAMEAANVMPEKSEKPKVELKTVKYQSFDEADQSSYSMVGRDLDKSSIDLIIDVPLQVTVLLGKTTKSIKEILELGRGSVIVLDRLAGEMVDVLVNGKLFARGEVVVIDDNYGVRITEMVSPEKAKTET